MSNVVRKRGGPNRGGGRGSKPRGGQGGGHRGGQGGGHGGGKGQRSSGFAAETGARKGNFDYLDDDFVLMPRETSDRNNRTGSKGSSGRGSSGRGSSGRSSSGRGSTGSSGRGSSGSDRQQGWGSEGTHQGRGNDEYRGRGRGGPRGRGRGEPRKVQMQQLRMTTENQELVRDVLRELQGSEPSEISEQGYDELHNRSDFRFWTQDKSMVLEGATGFQAENENESQEELVNKYALLKLLKYGFHRDHCLAALEETNGDVGQALDHLLQECFHFSPKHKHKRKRTKSQGGGETDGQMQEALQQREEEAMALSSIYQEDFDERIPNRVWVMNFDLPHVTDHFVEKARSLQNRKQQMVDRSLSSVGLCRFYQQGHCRFGSKCKFWHKREGHSKSYQELCDNADAQVYQLEIRFPEGNLYPMEPPLVAFLTSNPDFPIGKSLNISNLLFEEAKEIAESASPVVFSLVSVLEDAPQMIKTLEQKLLPLSLAPSAAKPVEKKPAFKQGAGRGKPQNAAADNSTGHKPSNSCALAKGKDTPVGREQSEDSDSTDEDGGSSSSEIESEPAPVKAEKNQPMRRDKRAIERENRTLKEQFRKKKHSHSYKSFLADRQKLPAWKEQGTILETLDRNQVVVVSGMTGCGKTTQVPQFILDASLKIPGPSLCNIICTQPRRISAMAVAERVANERAVKLGGVVGYQIRLENKQSTSTRLLFCTTGILLRRLEGDFNLDGVSHVIVDEVHERSEESDFLMMVLRDLLPKRKDLRVLLMSATLNAELFSSYFNGCPVIDIPGRTFPVEQYFLEDAIEWTNYKLEENSTYSRPIKRSNAVPSDSTSKQLKNYQYGGVEDEIEEALASTSIKPAKDNMRDWNLTVQQLAVRYCDYSKSTIKVLGTMDAEKINNDLIEELVSWIVFGDHEYPKDGAILIFLPGLAEILSCYEQLQSSLGGPRAKKQFKLVPLHSSLSSEEQNSAFLKPKEGVTKIVIATNIAETSITIDDIVYVIDAGKMKEKRYDSSKGMESLETTWVSRANALQRRGRAGRVTEGVCFHLYTANTYQHHLRDQPIPEIQRIPLEQLVLRVKILDLFKGMSVREVLSNLLEPPPISNNQDAILRLQNLGALDKEEGLTSLGYHLASLPVDVRIGKLMLFGAIFRCLDPVLTIAASLSFKSPFVAPFDKRDQADKKKLEFAIGNSDHLTLLRAYKGWTTCIGRGSYNGYRYCHENFLSLKTLQMIASMKHQFAELLSSIGFIKEGLSSKMMDRKTGGNGDAVLKMCGPEGNANADNSRLVLAVLCAALYPNVVQVMTPESKYSQTSAGAVPKAPRPEDIRFKTRDDGYVNVHPSSVNFQVRHYESPYLVFHEKIKTSKVYIRDCSMVSVYPLLLFGGCDLSINMDRGRFIISLDEGWIRFNVATVEVAELVRELRLELDQLLQDKIQQPNMDLCTCPRGSRIITAIVQLITTQ
ncbi:putative ATP-dependent RNA helicase DHX57 [Patiria miniata]|uniref:Putative ATP-dependent RNA helicase DHX57 n=1 Tax=Patiria miniata TaxID=46514 RepID=A0A914BB22_PATMI|nr:putative ATP-dependent RNA helicase DHX57 [Patiria miniata]XP_038072637.1 putative ATP-dependent RNA helicase DHX57 [Patiria miniata]XP_038072638.1 putative ATP-dependent RNA helicase DHX57 [Patiria miniata]